MKARPVATRTTVRTRSAKKPDRQLSVPMANAVATPSKPLIAKAVLGPVFTSAVVAQKFAGTALDDVSLADACAALAEQARAVNRGDLHDVETMLVAQASALNAMFGSLASRAHANAGEHFPAAESYLRLALKAQSQCRTTLETLATIKNPPVVFARQANISNGPQQVNNGVAHTEAPKSLKNEVIE